MTDAPAVPPAAEPSSPSTPAEPAAEPVLLAVAPNGARRGHGDHPRLPVGPAELADVAVRAADAGAAMIHLHVRDDNGRHSLNPDRYRAAVAAVEDAVGDRLLIQATSEAAGIYRAPDQIAAMRALMPGFCSLALREFLPPIDKGAADPVAEAALQGLLEDLGAAGCGWQWILYDAADVYRLARLRDRGVLPAMGGALALAGGAAPVLYVLGRYAPGGGRVGELVGYLAAQSDTGFDDPWMVCAFGAAELAATGAAVALGGHARLGFENNMNLKNGRTAPDNAALITQAVAVADALGRPLADAAAARRIFGLA
ncbi:3-keto-5-aminohexanoate cleavage protein [Tistrella bauzanensis]|uniref:3-keto-5-aminohexanoate cleavage protein n=1 Tax=Tistrella bauzanensis TaxID=657419 RepID=A0ABQ1ILB5_9PROT|nr:3-keto-5-aminohexanoate cleavage protein [Tistrella bauzanensis]GGB45950.1 3-keto-5-aminohexanoate cleavage protein [Tistrella bauzanensis]